GEDFRAGVDVTVTNPDGLSSGRVHIELAAAGPNDLTDADVKTIIAQAVAQAEAAGLKATVAVVDREGNVLGLFAQTGARSKTTIGVGRSGGLEGLSVDASA